MAVDCDNKPYLSVVVQPQNRFRFRYESEMRGTHGMLVGDGDDSVTKRFPSVKLNFFRGKEAIIRVSLATNEAEPFPHVHSLVAEKGQGKNVDYIDVTVNASSDYTAVFQGIAIIHRGKRFVQEVLTNRIARIELQRFNSSQPHRAQQELHPSVLNKIQELVKRKASGIDPHAVKLKFEAFAVDAYGNLIQIAHPTYSNPIFNEKGAQTGTLKIVKIDKAYSSCRGRDEIFIFVEKVSKKNIKVRFYELDPVTKQENWDAFADFTESDVHHQYAIAFRTPPFRDVNIDEDVQVFMELYRPQDGARSEPRPFTYKPCENPRKRPREYGDVNGLNDQLISIFKSIVEDSSSSYGSSSKSTQRTYNSIQTYAEETFTPNPKWTLAPMQNNMMSSMSISPRISPNSSLCGSPVGTIVSPQHPHSVSSAGASPYASSEFRYEESTPVTFNLDDLTENGELPDFFDLASPYTDTRCDFVQPRPSNGYEMIIDDGMARGGPPQLSSYSLSSDSVGNVSIKVESAYKNGDKLIDMIGGLSLNDQQLGQSNASAERLDVSLPNGTSNQKDDLKSKQELKELQNLGSILHTFLSLCDDVKLGAVIKQLVQKGAFSVFDWKNTDGLTALHVAVSCRKISVTEELVRAGASVNIADRNGDNVLHITASDDKLAPFLEVLIQGRGKEAALTRRNNQGFTPLHVAVEESSHKNLMLLLQNGADPNASEYRRGRTPLHMAAELNCFQSVKTLLDFGKEVDVNVESYNSETALDLTTSEKIKVLLIEAGGVPRGDTEDYSIDL